MKFILLFLALALTLRAEENPKLAALKAADSARIAALTAPTAPALETILSDDLRYAHSSGTVDTKKSFIQALTSGKMKYASITYDEQNFTFPAPTIALMNGRAQVKVSTEKGDLDMQLAFLSVWREENGQWRFLAWQSCKLPPAAK
jgi:Domain of unknown function (DUF4440)